MNRSSRAASTTLAGLLVGLGVAVFAKAVVRVGFDQLTVEHLMGPGLVLVGLLRLRLQRALDGRRGTEEEGGDGDAP